MSTYIRVCKFGVSFLGTINFFSFIGFVSGFLLLVFFCAATKDQRGFFDTVDFPIPNVSNVVIDAEGHVVVNITTYGRVQIYDQSGRFLRGFFFVAPMEPSVIGFDPDGNISIVTHRGDRVSVFAADGTLLREGFGGRKIKSEWEEKRQWTRDSGDREYLVRNKWLSPQVVRVHANDEEVFLATPFYLWPFVAPVPCLISVFLTQFVIKRLKRKIPGSQNAKTDLIANTESEDVESRTSGGSD